MIALTHIPARNAALEVGKELTPDSVGEGGEVEEGGHSDLIERESKSLRQRGKTERGRYG